MSLVWSYQSRRKCSVFRISRTLFEFILIFAPKAKIPVFENCRCCYATTTTMQCSRRLCAISMRARLAAQVRAGRRIINFVPACVHIPIDSQFQHSHTWTETISSAEKLVSRTVESDSESSNMSAKFAVPANFAWVERLALQIFWEHGLLLFAVPERVSWDPVSLTIT